MHHRDGQIVLFPNSQSSQSSKAPCAELILCATHEPWTLGEDSWGTVHTLSAENLNLSYQTFTAINSLDVMSPDNVRQILEEAGEGEEYLSSNQAMMELILAFREPEARQQYTQERSDDEEDSDYETESGSS